MDRRNFYYKQRVTEAEMDAAFDDAETATWNLVKDIGMFGVVLNGEVTENAPTNLTVDVNGPGTCYDQAGQRIYWGVIQDVDCENDYLGNPTVPTVVGEKVWISLHARFARNLQDLRIDGNGNPVYWIHGEYFEIRVVAGTPAGGGGHTKLAKPTDAVLLADIELDFGQTAIVNADISTLRRDDFAWTLSSNISVDDSAWSNLGPAANVQTALDSVDDVVLDRSATGDITEDIIPSALGKILGESATAWDAYLRNLVIVTGGSIVAASDGLVIGGATERFDVHVLDGICYNIFRPDTTGRSLGDATRRWDGYLEDTTLYGTLALSAANSTTLVMSSRSMGLQTGGAWNHAADYLTTTTDQEEAFLTLKGIPDGAEITQISVSWYQAAAGAGPTQFTFGRRAFGAASFTAIGGATSIGGYAAQRTDSLSGLTETLDLAANEYQISFVSGQTSTHRIYALEISYNYTNLLAAIQAC